MADHTLSTVRKARMMREAGWSYPKIGKALRVHQKTVWRWCNPDSWDACRESLREAREKERLEKAKEIAADLWEEGLPLKSISFILDRYHDVQISHKTVARTWLPEDRTRRPRGKPFGERSAA